MQVRRHARERLPLEHLLQQRTVGQAGEAVIVGGVFRAFALRDVLDQAFERDRFPVLVCYTRSALPDPADAAFRVRDTVLDIERSAFGKFRSVGLVKFRANLNEERQRGRGAIVLFA